MGCGGSPGVCFSVDEGDAGEAEVDTAEFVDGVDVWWGIDVEGFTAGNGCVFEVNEARDKGQLVLGRA